MAPLKPSPYRALEGKYVLHQTLGTGGFAKVKLATHVLTGEKVAVKIMDKSMLGDDLPRVQLEMEALKALNHPNICKLYQVIETENRFFLILEYCPGGELFDYIIERDKVTEKEARGFFRQIISAVSYIHGKGYAHRDLKPENILLDGDHNLKLIDFGLCAKPRTGMQQQLDTCCGSPAYAAPELITGDNYNGNKVDIWSMGVLLYALLCGFLPFDDENVTKLYRKIQKGRYFCPSWLSTESKSILADMLQVNPGSRISIDELKVHPWIEMDSDIKVQWHSQKQINGYDPECLAELAVYHKRPIRLIETSLIQNKFDHLAASYNLLLAKKLAGKQFSLIQPSVLRESKCSINLSSAFDTSPISKTSSMDSLANSDLLSLGSPPSISQRFSFISNAASPVFIPPREVLDKENFALPKVPSAKKYKKSSSKKSTKSSTKTSSKENYESPFKPNICDSYMLHSPKPLVFSASLDTAVHQVGSYLSTPSSMPYEKRTRSFDSPSVGCVTPKRRPPRHLGSSAKKVFGSIEKGLESMKNLLTPKKRMYGANCPRQVKNLCNVSATNDKVTPEEVLDSLQNALLRKGIPCKQKGYTLRGKICEGKRIRLRFELEVCQLPKHQGAIGVRRKRLEGDAWYYKKICEEVLRLALLDASVATTDV